MRSSAAGWVEQAYPNLLHYNQLEKGGHFAAWEQPSFSPRGNSAPVFDPCAARSKRLWRAVRRAPLLLNRPGDLTALVADIIRAALGAREWKQPRIGGNVLSKESPETTQRKEPKAPSPQLADFVEKVGVADEFALDAKE